MCFLLWPDGSDGLLSTFQRWLVPGVRCHRSTGWENTFPMCLFHELRLKGREPRDVTTLAQNLFTAKVTQDVGTICIEIKIGVA